MKSILIYNSGGGLGDSIQLFKLILSLQKYYINTKFYYLGAHENHFIGKLKEFNIKILTLDLGVKYFGFRWWHFLIARKKFLNSNIDKIDLIIDIQSKFRNTIILKKIPHTFFYSSTYNFRFCTKKLNYSSKDHLVNLNKFLNTEIKVSNFNLDTLQNKYVTEALRLLPGKNYVGFSITQGNVYRKKSWDIENFINLANRIVLKKKIPVFFIEKNNIALIDKIKSKVPEALFPEQDSIISCPALVTALSSRLQLAISIDNGVMHMMSLANIPMIVLFGPTNSEKFAPTSTNVVIIDAKSIYKSKDINRIKVQNVLDNINF